MSAHEPHSSAAAAAAAGDEEAAAAAAHQLQQAQAAEMTAMAEQAQLHFQAQAHTLQLQAQAQQAAMYAQQQQIAGATAAQAAVAMQLQQPTTTAKTEKSELAQYQERVDKKAKKAAARSNKKGASDEGAYRLDEFQRIGQAAVRRAEKKEYEDDPKELRRLRRRRGQPAESDSSDSDSSDDSSGSSNSDSSGDSDSDSDGNGRARKRRKKGSEKKGTKKPAEVVEWVRFKKGHARCKGRTKAERRAERYYARVLGVQSRFTSTSLEMEARRLHQVRMLVAQMGATTATPAQIVRVVSNMLETMSDALLAFDSGLARSADTPSLIRALNGTIADAAGRQAPQFRETAARTLRGATTQQQWHQQ